MASSILQNDRPSNRSNYGYEVFLNHRGPDTKKGFTGHLYHRLCSHGIRVFLDKEAMQEGDEIPYQIKTAIKTASVHVTIFSENYAKSSWCLDELVLMVESLKSGAVLIPVFYDVKPAVLRWTQVEDDQKKEVEWKQTGSRLVARLVARLWKPNKETQQGQGQIIEPTARGVYAQGLQTLKNREHNGKRRYDDNTIEKWREALSRVADISGFELEACNGYEGDLVEKIVEHVSKIMKKTSFNVPNYEIGLDGKLKDFEGKVLSQPRQIGKPHILGIVGLGGVGKTTLAKELFNKRRSSYKNSCFFPVSEIAGKTSVYSLFGELFKRLTRLDLLLNNVGVVKNLLNGDNPSLKMIIQDPSLVILDGVDNVDQGDALLPIHEVFDFDSLILITSRDRDVLTHFGVEEASIYTLNGLNTQCSRKLFCFYAFHEASPFQGYEYLVVDFSRVCEGLPLLLKVFGSFLYGKNDRSYWEDLLDRFQQIFPNEIEKKLKLIYDGLNIQEQEVFLDIACVFMGESTDTALQIWKGSGRKGLLLFQTLVEKRLVEVDSKNCIKMHDHLKDLGKNIAEKRRVPRPLWPETDNNTDLLQEPPVITELRIKIDDLLRQSSVNAQVITELRRKIDDLSRQSSMTIITLVMMMAMLARRR